MPRPHPAQGLGMRPSNTVPEMIASHVGNVLIDALMMLWYGKEFDQDGTIVRIVTTSSTPFSHLMRPRSPYYVGFYWQDIHCAVGGSAKGQISNCTPTKVNWKRGTVYLLSTIDKSNMLSSHWPCPH